MEQYVIYKNDDGTVALLVPSPNALKEHTIYEIAVKDVPPGKPFKIVSKNDIPFEQPQFAWVVADSDLTDGIGGESNEFN